MNPRSQPATRASSTAVVAMSSAPYSVVAYLFLLVGFVSLVQSLAWTGFMASDDSYYVRSGLGWLNEFPYVAEHFGTVRAAVGIPMAVVIGFFGLSEVSVVLSTAFFLVGTVVVSFFALFRHLPISKALVICAGLATVPVLALKSTIPSADLPELFFVALSFWLFWWATTFPSRAPLLLFSAGLAIGFAFSAHEVTAALFFFFGPLFLVGYRLPRITYLWMPLGFLVVIAAEFAYYAWAAGAPLHRWQLLVEGTRVSDRVHVGFLQFAAGGTIHVWQPIDPFLMFFTKHDIGLVGWLAAPALWWAFVTRRHDPSELLRIMRLLGGLALVWIVFAAIALQNLILLPRYYMVAAYALYLCAALWLLLAVWPNHRTIAVWLVCLAMLVHFAAIAIDNKQVRFGERALVRYLQTTSGAVVTDPMTAFNSTWFCRWGGVDCDRVKGRVPVSGDLYFHNPLNATRSNRFVRADELAAFRPNPDWTVVWRDEGREPLFSKLARQSGFAGWLPKQVSGKLVRQPPVAVVYKVQLHAPAVAEAQKGNR